jgi:hypothetical protein
MSKQFPAIFLVALALSARATAQQPAPNVTAPQPAGSAAKTPPAAAVPSAEVAGQPVNVKLDLTITDQMGPGEPAKRTVTMIVADRQSGSIRSQANQGHARMYVDATPTVLPGGDIRVYLGMEYNPRQPVTEKPAVPGAAAAGFAMIPTDAPTGGSSLNQRITLILQPGKPMVISQAADPVSDRKITVEVRASLLK